MTHFDAVDSTRSIMADQICPTGPPHERCDLEAVIVDLASDPVPNT